MADQLQQFSKASLSSWRTDTITIKGSEVKEVDFLETKPNMFVLQNPNNTNLHVSISSIPTIKSYETRVDKNSTKTFGRPTPTNKLYILNTSTEEVTINLYSINDDFDISILSDFTVLIDDNIQVSTDGIVKGFQAGVTLPAGSNKIGKVGLDDVEKIDLKNIANYSESNNSKLESIKSNVQSLTTDNITLLQLLESIKTNTTPVPGINGDAETMTDSLLIRHLYHMGDSYNTPTNYLNKVNEMTYVALDKCKVHFNYLLNDGAEFDVIKTDLESTNITLLSVYPGEQLTEIEFELEEGETISINSTGTFRAKYYIY